MARPWAMSATATQSRVGGEGSQKGEREREKERERERERGRGGFVGETRSGTLGTSCILSQHS